MRFWLASNLSMFIKVIDSYSCLLKGNDSPKLPRNQLQNYLKSTFLFLWTTFSIQSQKLKTSNESQRGLCTSTDGPQGEWPTLSLPHQCCMRTSWISPSNTRDLPSTLFLLTTTVIVLVSHLEAAAWGPSNRRAKNVGKEGRI